MVADNENTDFYAEPFLTETAEEQNSTGEKPLTRRAVVKSHVSRPAGNDLPWNVLTVLVLLGMLSMIMAVVTLLVNPDSRLNPFKPVQPTLVSAVHIPTMTASPLPSRTPTRDPAAAQSLDTATPVTPTVTFTPSPVPTETFTPGPSPTATIYSIFPFTLRGEVKAIDGATFPEHDTCRLWVAGQAYDIQGAPITGATVMLGGVLERKSFNQLSLTGTALQYGPAGYEFTIADHPVKSKQSVWVQLFDQAMLPLSARIYFDTSEDCTQNLVLINFRQVR